MRGVAIIVWNNLIQLNAEVSIFPIRTLLFQLSRSEAMMTTLREMSTAAKGSTSIIIRLELSGLLLRQLNRLVSSFLSAEMKIRKTLAVDS